MRQLRMKNGQVVEPDTRCSGCKQGLLQEWSYCPHCGTEVR
jgi:rRNA maturation endonuclease Nob1